MHDLVRDILEEFALAQALGRNGDMGRTPEAWMRALELRPNASSEQKRERRLLTHMRIMTNPARKAKAREQQKRSVAARRATPEGLESLRAKARERQARRYAKIKAARAAAKGSKS